jgi:hypothetical protein
MDIEETIVKLSPVTETDYLCNSGTRGGYLTPLSMVSPPPAALIALGLYRLSNLLQRHRVREISQLAVKKQVAPAL